MSVKTRPTLLERLRDGKDQLSWEEFFRIYWPVLFAMARRNGCSQHTAEEVVQDVMLRTFEHRDVYQYDPERSHFRAWLATLVRNQVAERRRKASAKERARGGQPECDPCSQQATAEPPPDSQCESAFEESLLPILLDVVRREVAPATLLAFELNAVEGLSGKEVSKITGLSRNAIYKARRRVMKRLEELGGDYRRDGRLDERLRRAFQDRPSAVVERSLTQQVDKTMRSR